MHIALVQNPKSSACHEAFQRAKSYLSSKNVRVTCIAEKEHVDQKQIQSFDLAISFGGDGAFLHALHLLGEAPPPIVGVNLGSLGFLAEIQSSTLEQSLQEICDGKCTIADRMMLEIKDALNQRYFAVNEVAFHRETTSNLVDLTVTVDKELFNTFSSDGLIIATPSGSTAYSLSAGGPIVSPNLDAVLITPICPHTITNRPVVICPHASIDVSLSRGAPFVGVAIDGIHAGSLLLNDQWSITLSPHRFKFLTFDSYNYFQTLREKLGWSGSLRKET